MVTGSWAGSCSCRPLLLDAGRLEKPPAMLSQTFPAEKPLAFSRTSRLTKQPPLREDLKIYIKIRPYMQAQRLRCSHFFIEKDIELFIAGSKISWLRTRRGNYTKRLVPLSTRRTPVSIRSNSSGDRLIFSYNNSIYEILSRIIIHFRRHVSVLRTYQRLLM